MSKSIGALVRAVFKNFLELAMNRILENHLSNISNIFSIKDFRFLKMNEEERKEETNFSLACMLLTRSNSPARLEQIAAKHLLLRVLDIIECNKQNAIVLCYCHKYSGCAPEWCFKFYCCEVCQMHTDFHNDIEFHNDFRLFVKVVLDIFSRRDKILHQIASCPTLYNLEFKHHLTNYYSCFDEILIDEHLLFV